jgi:hypothetical protein
METITAIEAVRRATDPFGMSGQHTSAMRPSAGEVIDRLAELGFVVVLADDVATDYEINIRDPWITESEARVLDGNR